MENQEKDKYKPELFKASFTFYQEGNCIDGGTEELEVICKSSMGIDSDKGCFYVLKTEQWAFDSIEEIQLILNRVNEMIKVK